MISKDYLIIVYNKIIILLGKDKINLLLPASWNKFYVFLQLKNMLFKSTLLSSSSEAGLSHISLLL